jgi:type I restriction enzyme S subunit
MSNVGNWHKCRLEEVSQIIPGQSPSSDTYNSEKNGLPFYQGKADFGLISPTPKVWCSEPIKIAEKDDILLSVRAPVGPTNIATEKCCIGRGLCAIRVNENTNRKFISYYFKMFENTISKMGSGSTFTAITTEDVKNLKILLPPFDEQERIVNIIETKLKSVKKLKDIFFDRTKYCEILSKSYFQKLFNDLEIKKLGDIASIITKGTTPTSIGFNFQSEGVNFIKIESISSDGKFLTDMFNYISVDCNNALNRSKLQENDILFSIAGALGRTAIVTNEVLPANINQAIALIRIPKDIIDYKYVFYILQSSELLKQFEKLKRGNAQLNLSLEDIRNLRIPLPSIQEQTQIAKSIETKLNSVEKIRIAEKEQLLYINALPSSVLRQAFEGKL